MATHLHPVPETELRSLRLALQDAASRFEAGDWQGGLDGMLDALWISHRGGHESVTDLDLILALRRIGGFGWAPPEDRA